MKHFQTQLRIVASGIFLLFFGTKTALAGEGWDFDIWAAPGFMTGEMQYQIGGMATDQHGENGLMENNPLSKLQYPYNVVTLTGNISVTYANLIEAKLSYTHNASNPSTQMFDSDWTDTSQPSQLTDYSVSDSILWFNSVDGQIKLWIFKKEDEAHNLTAAFGPGAGYYYQNISWDMYNLDAWQPPNPGWHYYFDTSSVLGYDVEVLAPYVGLYGKINASWITLEAGAAWCFIKTHEIDHHYLRDRITISDGNGDGLKADITAKVPLYRGLYLLANFSVYTLSVSATQRQYLSGVEMYNIGDKTKSAQLNYNLGLGYRF